MNRRKLIWFLGLLSAVFVVVAACAPAVTPTPTAAPTTAAPTAAPAPTQPPAAVDTITIGMSQEPDSLYSAETTLYVSHVVLNALEAALIERNDKNEYVPELAQSVPTVENGGAKFVGDGDDKHLEVTFKLKPGVKWSDGTPLTCKDFQFGYQLYQNPDTQAPDRSLTNKIAEVACPDDQTIVYKYLSAKQARAKYEQEQADIKAGKIKEAEAQFTAFKDQKDPVVDPLYNKVSTGDIPLVWPEHVLKNVAPKDIGKSDFARKPVGAGPYVVKEWVSGASITLTENPNYWGTKPKIKNVVFKIIPDTNTLLAQLRTGEIQVATEDALSISQAPELDKLGSAGVKVFYTPAMVWEHLDFNLDNPLFKDKNVRKAIAHAINRKDIVDKVLFGKTTVANTWLPPANWASAENPANKGKAKITTYDYDPNKAKQLLEQAGWKPGSDGILVKDGQRFSFTLETTAGNKMREQYTQIIQANLKAVGIEVNLKFTPAQQFFGSEGPLYRRTFETGVFFGVAGDDPGGLELWTCKNIPKPENNYSGQNIPGWCNSQNDELLQKAFQTLSDQERLPLYLQQQEIFTDELPVLPLFYRLNVAAARADLQNFKPTPTQTPPTWNVEEWFLPKK